MQFDFKNTSKLTHIFFQKLTFSVSLLVFKKKLHEIDN